jgi:CheY-like chemotaxis protein
MTRMTSGKTNILIAEDNAALARVLQFNLSKAGYEVTLAKNGRIALELASRQQFDLVVSDHQMPEMTRVELCQQLRNLAAYKDVPIMLLTAKGLELDHARLRDELGISGVYAKPFSPIQIVQTVASLLTPVA